MSGAGATPKGRLGVLIDGAPMPEEEARAVWERFSAWMEEHKGDLAGFAAQEGFASVFPGVEDGRPVLRLSRSAPQRPYAPVRAEGGRGGKEGGSPTRHPEASGLRPRRPRDRRSQGKKGKGAP